MYLDGVSQAISLIDNSPSVITIIAIGPTTNIAEILRRRPDLAKKVFTRFFLAKTNYHFSNMCPREWNFFFLQSFNCFLD